MREYRTIIVLGVIVLLLGGLWFWLDNSEDVTLSGVLFTMEETESIAEVAITNSYGQFSFMPDGESEQWLVVAEGEAYRAHAEKMHLILAALQEFTITRVLEENRPEYGLEEPAIVVQCVTTEGEKYIFGVGAMTAGQNEVYIQDGDTGAIMVSTTAAVAQFDGSISAYRDKEVFTIDHTTINTITYHKDGEQVFSVAKNGSQDWVMTQPLGVAARHIELNEFLSTVTGWTVAGFPEVGVNNYAEMGLQNPTEWMEFTDEAGNTQRIEIGTRDDTYTFVRTGDDNEIALLYTADLDFSSLTVDGLIFYAPLQTTVDEVTAIQIQSEGATTVFEVEQTEGGQIVSSGGKSINTEQFTSVFFAYTSMIADGYEPDMSYEQTPVAQLTTTYTDGSTKTLNLLPYDETNYAMLMEGESRPQFYIAVEELEQLLYRIDAALQ